MLLQLDDRTKPVTPDISDDELAQAIVVDHQTTKVD